MNAYKYRIHPNLEQQEKIAHRKGVEDTLGYVGHHVQYKKERKKK